MHDYDILNLIRSEEIREYFRKNWKMNIEQKLSLVARSYVDISVKIEYLRHLAEQCDRKERALVLDMIKYMELGYRSITQPETSALYVLHILGYDGPDLDDEEDFDLNDTLDIYEDRHEYFISYKEVIKYLEIERNGSETIDWGAYVEQINFPFTEEQLDEERDGLCRQYVEDWGFWLFWSDGKWILKSFEKYLGSRHGFDENMELWCKKIGISKAVVDMSTNFDYHELGHQFSLPFERGTKLKLQTPFMEKPIFGTFDSYSYSAWQNHLYLCADDSFPFDKSTDNTPEEERVNGNHLILSYQMLTGDSNIFSTWDWLERA